MKQATTLLFLLCFVVIGCGVTHTTFLDDNAREEIMRESDSRILKIVLRDNTIEYGSHLSIGSDVTEWNVASVRRRNYDETNIFKASDTWRIDAGNVLRTVKTSEITSITIPGDGLTTGILVGGVVGAGVGAGFYSAIRSSSNGSINLNTLAIVDGVLFTLEGAIFGGTVGATHNTEFIRDSSLIRK
jgi:hypothetical protein